MSRLFTESFEAGHLLRFTGFSGNAPSIVTSPVLDGLRCISMDTGSEFVDLTTSVTEFYAGFFFRIQVPTNGPTIFKWENSSTGAVLGTLRIDPGTQRILAYTGDTATLVGTGIHVIVANTNYHFQVHVTIANAGGVLDVKLDDTSEITFVGDTQPGADTTVNRYRLIGSNTSVFFDSLTLNSTTGAIDNSWPGVLRFQRMLPTGPGNYVNNWSRNTGANNWDAVDEVPHDSDTTYLFTTTANLYESFSMADHTLTNAIFKALLTAAIAKKDSGTVQLALGIRDNDNSTDYFGANSTLGTSYGVVEERRTVDPSTGVAWVAAGLNASEALIVSTTG